MMFTVDYQNYDQNRILKFKNAYFSNTSRSILILTSCRVFKYDPDEIGDGVRPRESLQNKA